MRSVRFGGILASVLAAGMASVSVEPAGPPEPRRAARPRPTRYEPKMPTSALDFERLEAAERKRARKAAKRMKQIAGVKP